MSDLWRRMSEAPECRDTEILVRLKGGSHDVCEYRGNEPCRSWIGTGNTLYFEDELLGWLPIPDPKEPAVNIPGYPVTGPGQVIEGCYVALFDETKRASSHGIAQIGTVTRVERACKKSEAIIIDGTDPGRFTHRMRKRKLFVLQATKAAFGMPTQELQYIRLYDSGHVSGTSPDGISFPAYKSTGEVFVST